MWLSHHAHGYAAARTAASAEPSSIDSCSHVQHAQKLVTSPRSAPLVSKPPPPPKPISWVPGAGSGGCPAHTSRSHHRLYQQALHGQRALASKPCSKPGGNRTWLLYVPRDAPATRTGHTDKPDPKDASTATNTHTGPEHLLDWPHGQHTWGTIPIPLGHGQGSPFWHPGSA